MRRYIIRGPIAWGERHTQRTNSLGRDILKGPVLESPVAYESIATRGSRPKARAVEAEVTAI